MALFLVECDLAFGVQFNMAILAGSIGSPSLVLPSFDLHTVGMTTVPAQMRPCLQHVAEE